MGDSTLSHEAITRFEAIEARLDALDGGSPEQQDEGTEVESVEEDEAKKVQGEGNPEAESESY